MNLSAGVAVRISALCLAPNGRLLASDAVRGALLLDLALSGRLTSTDESTVVDQSPTGFGPADRLLAAINAEPQRSLDGWLAERRLGLRDVAEANVASGRWEGRPGGVALHGCSRAPGGCGAALPFRGRRSRRRAGLPVLSELDPLPCAPRGQRVRRSSAMNMASVPWRCGHS